MTYDKRCELDYLIRGYKYYSSISPDEREKIGDSITEYLRVNGTIERAEYNYTELGFLRFIMDNLGDDTIIEAVTGFKG
jgi:hypothetical protein